MTGPCDRRLRDGLVNDGAISAQQSCSPDGVAPSAPSPGAGSRNIRERQPPAVAARGIVRGHAVLGVSALRARIAEPWTLSSLAEEVHLSRSQLVRAFDASVGMSPMAYLRQMRVRKMAWCCPTPICRSRQRYGRLDGRELRQSLLPRRLRGFSDRVPSPTGHPAGRLKSRSPTWAASTDGSSAEGRAGVDLSLGATPRRSVVLAGRGLGSAHGERRTLMVELLPLAGRVASQRLAAGDAVAVPVGSDGANLPLPDGTLRRIGGRRPEPASC